MAWIYLVLAGFLEIGWPIGLKLGWSDEGIRALWLAFAIACILFSGLFLLMAIPAEFPYLCSLLGMGKLCRLLRWRKL